MYYVSYIFIHFPPTFIFITVILNAKLLSSMTKCPTIPYIYTYTNMMHDSSYNEETMLCSIQ